MALVSPALAYKEFHQALLVLPTLGSGHLRTSEKSGDSLLDCKLPTSQWGGWACVASPRLTQYVSNTASTTLLLLSATCDASGSDVGRTE